MKKIILIILLLIGILCIFVNLFVNLFMNLRINKSNFQNSQSLVLPNRKVYISLTTIPSRLESSFFYSFLKHNISSVSSYSLSLQIPNEKFNFIIVLNIPYLTLKGKKYKIPKNISKLASESKNFEIYRCDVDEGPITKLLPSLRRKDIKNDDIIIIIDDDQYYYRDTFLKLVKNILKNPLSVTTFCKYYTLGYLSFGFVKSTMIGLLKLKIPDECIRIDDDVIYHYIIHKNIPISRIKTNTLSDTLISYFKKHKDRDCSSFDQIKSKISQQLSGWPELQHDNRNKINSTCFPKLIENLKYL